MVVDVAQCKRSNIKYYASVFSNIQIKIKYKIKQKMKNKLREREREVAFLCEKTMQKMKKENVKFIVRC